jgi:beta-N-acetylhexosaminidase
MAVGVAPWAAWADERTTEASALRVPAGRQLVLIGRDNHRHAWVRELIENARLQHPSTIVVDMGWPGDDRAYADIATFGASAHVGSALLHWFERASATTETIRHNSESGTDQ